MFQDSRQKLMLESSAGYQGFSNVAHFSDQLWRLFWCVQRSMFSHNSGVIPPQCISKIIFTHINSKLSGIASKASFRRN